MALLVTRNFSETKLDLDNAEKGFYSVNHILEPEFHQEKYVTACERIQSIEGSFQLGVPEILGRPISRGIQPKYADDETDPDSLTYEGMILADGSRYVDDTKNANVCALKSNCIRSGYIDTSLARSVTRAFYEKNKKRAGVQKNDILINSTGDGTIGRVAVYNYDFPAVVDGHITIVRLKDPNLAWYTAAFLLTEDGQNQMYRYINGSSGQVEIYPQDISRIWIAPATQEKRDSISSSFKKACIKHDEFYRDLTATLNAV